jgi:hypothetical protein
MMEFMWHSIVLCAGVVAMIGVSILVALIAAAAILYTFGLLFMYPPGGSYYASATRVGESSKRDELKKLRVRVASLEEEILEGEKDPTASPMRSKQGISTDDR